MNNYFNKKISLKKIYHKEMPIMIEIIKNF